MKISELLTDSLIKVNLEASDKEEAFEELIDLLVEKKRISDREAARTAIIERENKQSTGIGRGVAIPHGKSETIWQLTAALGVSRNGIEYDSLDGEPVHIVFLLLAEQDNPGPHIEALAQVAMLFKTPGFIERLIKAETPREARDVIIVEEEREE
jgi:fructose-specific phosphotransferase system IIA component